MRKSRIRKVDVVVISDVHLGTSGSHARELLQYLRSIRPRILILNGDIIDIWQFNKRYWPRTHMKVIEQIIRFASKNTKVVYITGNHDEMLRKFNDLKIGNISIVNKYELEMGDKKAMIFHGDVFDVIIQHSKWLAKLGSIGYDTLILINTFLNFFARKLGREKLTLSKVIKDNIKLAVKYIGDFEKTAAETASRKGFHYVICGHIHQPQQRIVSTEYGEVVYMNSGDWIENLSSLEYHKGKWKIYRFSEDKNIKIDESQKEESDKYMADFENKELFQQMLSEFAQIN